MRLRKDAFEIQGNGTIRFRRDAHGVFHVTADDEEDLYRGLGYCHALDRGLQLLLTRILGRGQASEFLKASDEMLAVDRFFRRMNWHGTTAAEVDRLDEKSRRLCSAYCDGVNRRLAEAYPFEFKLIGYRPTPWTIEDSILLTRMTGYISLAQSHGEMERLIVQFVQSGISRSLLEELFPGQFEGLDESLLRKVRIHERIVPEGVQWNPILPTLMASNNWVIAASKTASGKPILSNDPHLEVNRLPPVWHEIVLRLGDRYLMGVSMPGLPAVVIGRTNDLAWGATYTFMDAIDSWIEQCNGRKYRRDGEWIPFRIRRETIRRKKRPPVDVTFYENDHGVLDGDPNTDGYYLATRWSSADSGAVSMSNIQAMLFAKDVPQGMQLLGRLELSFNWVLADRSGNIGYQMSGLMPRRRDGVSGLIPLPGWDPVNDWTGFVSPEELPRVLNPPEGFIATANQDLNHLGRCKPMNIRMAPHRAERIEALLRKSDQWTVEGCTEVHKDLYSTQAERFMAILRPFIPDTPQGRLLKEWDLRYDLDSLGAGIFERFYGELIERVFGDGGLGRDVVSFLRRETAIFAAFFWSFDLVLLSESSGWFGGKSREDLYREALEAALKVPARPWREGRMIMLSHLFFGGRLPKGFGFDYGPIGLQGGRATVSQGQMIRNGGRMTSFAPSFRLVTDLSTDVCHTHLAGGPSDRGLSRWYASDLFLWLQGKYKVLEPRLHH
jgi:penicillin amidase